MIQGTGSNVGKSLLVAGLCRHFTNQGLKVRPFKPQNMSNNAAVTTDGGEIGRAQALQAIACKTEPTAHMNPVLLKPEGETGSQLIVQGQRKGSFKAKDFYKQKQGLMQPVLQSFELLKQDADLVIVEGAGSASEMNLRQNDIANMGFAQAADVPVVLVGDIDRGGVIAQMVGTHAVLSPDDRKRIFAFLINKFRGDVTLFDEGLSEIALRTGWAPLGVLPWFADAWRLPAEDVMDIASTRGGDFKVAVPRLARIANFDDLDPLAAESGVTVDIVNPGRALPGDADLVLIPGSKSTIADLADFRANGWDIDLQAHVRRGGHVLGLCGGYQMLGRKIVDADGIEGRAGSHDGLGLLDVETRMSPQKQLTQTTATYLPSGDVVSGYEIHIGTTTGPDCARAWLQVGDRPEGASNRDGRIRGCYLHGLFSADGFRATYLAEMSGKTQGLCYDDAVEKALDTLAAHIEAHIDVDQILSIARVVK